MFWASEQQDLLYTHSLLPIRFYSTAEAVVWYQDTLPRIRKLRNRTFIISSHHFTNSPVPGKDSAGMQLSLHLVNIYLHSVNFVMFRE